MTFNIGFKPSAVLAKMAMIVAAIKSESMIRMTQDSIGAAFSLVVEEIRECKRLDDGTNSFCVVDENYLVSASLCTEINKKILLYITLYYNDSETKMRFGEEIWFWYFSDVERATKFGFYADGGRLLLKRKEK